MEFEIKPGTEVSMEDFWFDLYVEGSLEPEKILLDPMEARTVEHAIMILKAFESALEEYIEAQEE
jgi:hypothetical protein